MLVQNIKETIGNTPLLRCHNIEKIFNLNSEVYAKLEMFNPGSSIKDRPVKEMLEKAINEQLITERTVLIEPTSGNTGIAIAMLCASLNIKCILVMPESMSIERRKLLTHLGAELILTEAAKGMNGAITKAKELLEENLNYAMLEQFDNPNNPYAHTLTTGTEIIRDLDNNIDFIVAGVGTSGTIMGIKQALVNAKLNTKVIAVEPASSAVISGNKAGPHKIQGIGAGFIPSLFSHDAIDGVIKVENDEAMEASRLLASVEGVLAGISSGASLHAAIQVARENPNKRIVFIAPDTAERYLSTELFK